MNQNAQRYLGRLTYFGWQRPWEVENEVPGSRRTFDMLDQFWNVAEALKGQPASQTITRDFYRLAADPLSPTYLDFSERGAGILVTRREGFGFSNVMSYLEAILCQLNARHVIVSVGPDYFEIRADPDHLKVPEVRYQDPGNFCRVPEDYIKAVCKAGQGKECCIFLMAGAGGFECAKFSGSTATYLLERMVLGNMNAGRIGNCRNVGRHEPAKEDSK